MRAAIYTTVRHWLDGHPWAFPLVIVLVVTYIVWKRLSRRKVQPAAKVKHVAPPGAGPGRWVWVEDVTS
jgi:hypothetical protein